MSLFKKKAAATEFPEDVNAEREQVEIVGESFFKESFKALKIKYKTKVGDEVSVRVRLVNERENPFGVEGKAVAAFVDDFKVGHVSNHQVESVFELLSKAGGSKTFRGSIYFDDLRETVARNSVHAELKLLVKRPVLPSEDSEAVLRKQAIESLGNDGKKKLLEGGWAHIGLVPGNVICFTGFVDDREALEKKAIKYGLVLGGVSRKLSLLIVNEDTLADSAKARDAIAKGVPIANLESYFLSNPILKP